MANRYHKVTCEDCGYVARSTAKWLDTRGAPLCPCHQNEVVKARAALALAEGDKP